MIIYLHMLKDVLAAHTSNFAPQNFDLNIVHITWTKNQASNVQVQSFIVRDQRSTGRRKFRAKFHCSVVRNNRYRSRDASCQVTCAPGFTRQLFRGQMSIEIFPGVHKNRGA